MRKLMTILTISGVLALTGLAGAAFADTVTVSDPAAVVPDPAAYVTVDAGAGFEMTLDAGNEVIGVEAVDEAGAAVVEGIDLSGQPVEEAISQLIDKAIADGVLPTDGSVPVDVAVITEDSATGEPAEVPTDGTEVVTEEDALTEAIEEALEEVTEELDVPVVVTYQNIALERVAMAKALGITPGKLNLIQKLAATTGSPETLVVADWTGKSVKEIMAAIKTNRNAAKVPETVEEPEAVGTADASTPAVEKNSGKNKSHGNGGGKSKGGKK